MTKLNITIVHLLLIFACSCTNNNTSCHYSTLKGHGEIEKFDEGGRLLKKIEEFNCFFDKKVILYDRNKRIKKLIYYIDNIYHCIEIDSIGQKYYSYGVVRNNKLKCCGFANFHGEKLNYLYSEFINVKPWFVTENDVCKCYLNIIYYTPAVPLNMYIIIKTNKYDNFNSFDTIKFDKSFPITGIEFLKEDSSKYYDSPYKMSKIYPCFYSKKIELKELVHDTNVISGAINTFYFAGKTEQYDTTSISHSMYFNLKIYKIKK